MNNDFTPRVYVACLAAYNNGFLHGEWIDINRDSSEIWEDIERIISTSPVEDAEEWAIHDTDLMGVNFEFSSSDSLSDLGYALAEHGQPLAEYIKHYGFNDESVENFQESYLGEFDSLVDYIAELYDDCGITEAVEKAGLKSYYIDWEAIARDAECGGEYLTVGSDSHQVYIFSTF
jgi:antirestriction protein